MYCWILTLFLFITYYKKINLVDPLRKVIFRVAQIYSFYLQVELSMHDGSEFELGANPKSDMGHTADTAEMG